MFIINGKYGLPAVLLLFVLIYVADSLEGYDVTKEDITQHDHLIVELTSCNSGYLDDEDVIEAVMTKAAEEAGATIVNSVFHKFEPQGVTGVLVLAESHLSIHTWPEKGYAAIDIFMCGEAEPRKAVQILKEGFLCEGMQVLTIKRGNDGSIVVK